MTKTDRPVKRETYSSVRQLGRWYPLIVELRPTYVRIRRKGAQRAYTVTYDQMWTLGAKNQAAADKAERAAKRKARQNLR